MSSFHIQYSSPPCLVKKQSWISGMEPGVQPHVLNTVYSLSFGSPEDPVANTFGYMTFRKCTAAPLCFWTHSLTFHLVTPSCHFKSFRHVSLNVSVRGWVFLDCMLPLGVWWTMWRLVMSLVLCSEWKQGMCKVITSRWHCVGDWLHMPLISHANTPRTLDLWAVGVSSSRRHKFTWITGPALSKLLIRLIG